jgi:hypothetical protein
MEEKKGGEKEIIEGAAALWDRISFFLSFLL